MKYVLTSLMVAALMSGCGLELVDEFRAASPSRQGIKVTVPQTQALTSSSISGRVNETNISQREVLGQTAEFYTFTVVVTGFVNGAVVNVLNLVEDIVSNDPTSVSNNQAVWGPYTAPLSPDTAMFTVTKNADGSFGYVFQGKPKNSPDSAYVQILTGQHLPGASHSGQGTFTLSLDAMHSLDNDPTQAGSISVQYARDVSGDVVVLATFTNVLDQQSGQLVNAAYAFAQAAGADGAFEFVLAKDFDGKGQIERLAVKSRWHQDGAGRSDILGTGGDLGTAQLQATECWDSNFLETYYADNFNANPTQGAASSCVFQTADYSKL